MTTEVLDSNQAADQAARIIGELAREADAPMEVDIDPDRTREFTQTGVVSRMRRTEWRPGDAAEIAGVEAEADGIIHREFPNVFLIMNEIWLLVRKPVLDQDGEMVRDLYGWPEWQKLPSGAYIEDYTRLTNSEKDNFLLRITMNLLEWEQKAARLRGGSQYARVRWEEAMSEGFIAPTGRLTVEERTQRGRAHAIDDRYFGVFRSSLSYTADALIKSVERIGQRLKDSLTA